MRNCIIASTSTVHDSEYLSYLLPELEQLFSTTKRVLFIPYARPGGISHDAYTEKAAEAFRKIGKELVGIHQFSDPRKALEEADGIFTGGGNTFVLVDQLYKNRLMPILREVLLQGTPYLGTSAGSNICGRTMQTTNDMPIVQPERFQTTGVLAFNINAHYLDPDPTSTHMGETRQTRIQEFHTYHTVPVVGLREGSWLRVTGNTITLGGKLDARIFEQGKKPYELAPGSDLNTLR